jgi:transposase
MTKIELPNDIEALKDLVIQKHELFTQEHQRAELFKHRYDLLARRYFGQSSEKRKDAPGQQMLFELPGEPERPAPAGDEQTETALRKKKHGGGRKPIPPELPRQEIKYTLPEEKRICTCCGEVMQPFGEEVTEQLEFIPASLFVIRHVKIKYACNKGCAEKPAIAPGPQKVIDRISAGPGLLAWNVVAKFQHHQPMYRQEDIFKQHGDEISRSTQCSWQATVADLLEPIYRRMTAHVVQSRKIHTDDTPIRVLEPGTGKTRTGRFWVYLGDKEHPFTIFDYTPNRSREGPALMLKGFKGYLQADAYGGYDRLYEGMEIIEVACWAHTRRKYFDARDTDALANEMLALIGELYAVEAEGRAWSAPERKLLRQMKTRPILDRIRAWLDEHAVKVLPKSPLGQAITYTLNQWTALTRFIEDGDLEADNNLGENALRPICLGRKNFLFVGSDAGGRRAAILYSLVRSCERHDVNVWQYLRDVLIRISTHPARLIDDLLPHRWKAPK